MSSGSSLTLTVPADTTVDFDNGTQILVVRGGTGAVGITGESGVNLRAAQNFLNFNYQNSGATLVKNDTDDWFVFGDLKA
jgi:hypothetical protein